MNALSQVFADNDFRNGWDEKPRRLLGSALIDKYLSSPTTLSGLRVIVPHNEAPQRIYEKLQSRPGDGPILLRARVEALGIISKCLADNLPLPSVSVGVDEINFRWQIDDRVAEASVEGEGLLGYAMLQGDVFVAGQDSEDVSEPTLPNDLVQYLMG